MLTMTYSWPDLNRVDRGLTCRSCRPIKSIKEIGSLLHPVWGMPAGVVGGKEWSLDDVENYLRKPPSPLK